MKKKEIVIIIVIALVAVLAIVGINVYKNSNQNTSSTTSTNESSDDPNATPSKKAKGEWVAIIHANKVAEWFDSGVNAEYTIQGDYGEMVVEVKDGSWHVKEVECPNHTCEQMGWDDGESIMPITCLPNNIIIMTSDAAQNYLTNE